MGGADGICRKMLRHCLMTLQGHSHIFQKFWRSCEVCKLNKGKYCTHLQKRQRWPEELHFDQSHIFSGKIMVSSWKPFLGTRRRRSSSKWLGKASMNSPGVYHAWPFQKDQRKEARLLTEAYAGQEVMIQLKQGGFLVDKRLKNIPMRTIKQVKLSREVLESPSLLVSRSDRTKSRATLSDLRADLAVSSGAGLVTSSEVPSNMNDFVIPRERIHCSKAPRLSKISTKKT